MLIKNWASEIHPRLLTHNEEEEDAFLKCILIWSSVWSRCITIEAVDYEMLFEKWNRIRIHKGKNNIVRRQSFCDVLKQLFLHITVNHCTCESSVLVQKAWCTMHYFCTKCYNLSEIAANPLAHCQDSPNLLLVTTSSTKGSIRRTMFSCNTEIEEFVCKWLLTCPLASGYWKK